MYEVNECTAGFGENRIRAYQRDVIGEENYLDAVAGTENEGGKIRTYCSLIVFHGRINVGPMMEEETGNITGIGIRAIGADARDCLIKALRFQLKVLEEERAEVDD